jgi:hypothetical protein
MRVAFSLIQIIAKAGFNPFAELHSARSLGGYAVNRADSPFFPKIHAPSTPSS